MLRVTSLTKMDDRQLNRWIKRVALLLVAGTIVFTGFYVLDRWRPPSTPIVDRRLSALEQAVRDNPEDIASRGASSPTRTSPRAASTRRSSSTTRSSTTGKETELATYGRAAAYMGLEQYDLRSQGLPGRRRHRQGRRDGQRRPDAPGRLLQPRLDRDDSRASPPTRSPCSRRPSRSSARTPTRST